MRLTSRSPSLNVPAACAVVVIAQCESYPYAADRKHRCRDDEVDVVLNCALDADEHHAEREDPPYAGWDQALTDQPDRQDQQPGDPGQRADIEVEVPLR